MDVDPLFSSEKEAAGSKDLGNKLVRSEPIPKELGCELEGFDTTADFYIESEEKSKYRRDFSSL